MTSLLLIGLLFVGLAFLVATVSIVIGSGEASGTARSLAIIENRISSSEFAKSELPASERLLTPIMDYTRALGTRLSPSGTVERLARRLDQAGNPPNWTVEKLLGAKGLGLIAGAVLALLLFKISATGLLAMLGGAALGFFIPDLLVTNIAMKRQDELRRGLADALDMLTVCVEAGQGFDAALQQVARNTEGPVAGEFARIMSEIQIGKPRSEAFAGLGARTTVQEIKNFVSALVQADRLGLPIAGVLREQSAEMRLARRQRAEEKAMQVPVKILFPMFLFIFPAVFIVILGPAVIRMIQTFSNI